MLAPHDAFDEGLGRAGLDPILALIASAARELDQLEGSSGVGEDLGGGVDDDHGKTWTMALVGIWWGRAGSRTTTPKGPCWRV